MGDYIKNANTNQIRIPSPTRRYTDQDPYPIHSPTKTVERSDHQDIIQNSKNITHNRSDQSNEYVCDPVKRVSKESRSSGVCTADSTATQTQHWIGIKTEADTIDDTQDESELSCMTHTPMSTKDHIDNNNKLSNREP